MPRRLHLALLWLRDLLISAGPLALLAAGLIWAAFTWMNPTPPRKVVLATGPAQSAYDNFGQRYRKALAAAGIEVELLPSAGSSANLDLITQRRADLGFVQGGSAAPGAADDSGIHSLGSLFVEPVWLFYRADAARRVSRNGELASLSQLKGLRVNVGTAGSGVPSLMDKLFEANRIERAGLKLSSLAPTPATVAFLAGELDALVFASAPESPLVRMLLQTPGIRLMDFVQSEAYGRRFAFLTPVVLPRGVVDLAADLPVHDVHLVASTTSLLAAEGTHPAIVQLFAQSARELHAGAGWFNRSGAFPSAEHSEYPLAAEADRAMRNGPSFLQRYLPFWLANLVERMWLALGIILAVLLPLSRVVPPIYQFRVRSRVFRWYAELRDIEEQLAMGGTALPELSRRLDALEMTAGQIQVPLSYAEELYALRAHIALVRTRLAAAAAGPTP